MRVLVTGGSGFVGRHLLRSLCEAGHVCRALVRASSDISPLADLPIEWVQGDITEPSTLRGIGQGIDVAYHLAAVGHVTALSAEAYRRFRQVNVEGTRHLMEALRGSGVSRVVHFSSTAAMGLVRRSPINEDAPCHPGTPYQKSKYEGEQAALQAWREAGLPVIILRPCMIYGPGGKGEFLRFCRLMARGLFPRLQRGPVLLPLVHVRDVVQAALLAAQRGTPGEVYLIASERSYELDRVRALVVKELGVNPPYPYIPLWLAMMGAFGCELLSRITGSAPPVTRRNLASTVASRVFDISKAKKDLGYRPAIPLEEGIRETVAWFREEGLL